MEKKESEIVEFKKSTTQLKEAVISLCAMLNKSKKGVVYFGIKDDGSICGQKVGKKTTSDISREVRLNLKPMPDISINVESIDDKEIIKLGGKFMFSTTYIKSESKENITYCHVLNNITKEETIIKTNHLLLALGHSARDTYETLYNDMKLDMEQKAFSMGVRIEHKREDIDKAQYGKFYKYLPAAYYNLAAHFNDRGVYTFCMCPGGYVLASTSDLNTIVVNGMSNEARENENSNSALLVDVKPSDYNKTSSPLDGIYYQYEYEKKAYEIASDYRAPANLVKEFLEDGVASSLRSIKTSYPHGIKLCNLKECLPDFVIENLKLGIKEFDKKIHGFNNPDAILIGIESRSSSPLRILRDKDTHESNIKGIYPIGEGAGYAGGITSAALDGLKTAILIVDKLNNL